MSIALQKTITLLLLIATGVLLRSRFRNQEAFGGIKEIILSVALPSTIFVALMKVEVNSSLWLIPLLTLIFNLLIYLTVPLAFPLFGLDRNSPAGRTILLLVPSLAPGLSCFPFIAEFLGQHSLALAALADVGNKFFVLIFLYVAAMQMFLRNSSHEAVPLGGKVRYLLFSLVKEPVNLVIAIALILLSLGLHYGTLPLVITDLMDKTSALMTPLVLLYIGLAVQWKESRKKLIVSVLFLRAGISLLLSAVLIAVCRITDYNLVLLCLVIPLSSASFWPLAHITTFHQRENQLGLSKERRSFDPDLAVLLLGFSLPLSTLLILGILSAGKTFVQPLAPVICGTVLLALGVIPYARGWAHRLSKT
ncbi:AEC family transporter [Flavihumibacter petaseus]|uniref:Permease n=1 Tax=Flavihumibacter petaseus NBRC 106054 TaxID=1220578 RepID=A0A0E9MVJ5_9BACT|nr:hypothetical protein [Flavihumibacter petaseus]GAO41604.1 hypothetical protein FPE01S_01_06180 [Flavihumibacter petaseus NBRC 106054]